MSERTLYLSHPQYAEMLEKHADLTRFIEGKPDDSQFIAWVMARYGLIRYSSYRIVVE